jgi:hypothetical protein
MYEYFHIYLEDSSQISIEYLLAKIPDIFPSPQITLENAGKRLVIDSKGWRALIEVDEEILTDVEELAVLYPDIITCTSRLEILSDTWVDEIFEKEFSVLIDECKKIEGIYIFPNPTQY